MRLRRSLVVIAAPVLLLAGCGDSIPTKAEFLDQMSLTVKSSFRKSLVDGGIDKVTADEIFDTWVGCVYDKVKDDSELVSQMTGDSSESEVERLIQKKAQPCQDAMTKAVTDALAKSASAG